MSDRSQQFIRNYGLTKSYRWWVCLHEAAHAVIFARHCGGSSHSYVFREGGMCCPVSPPIYLNPGPQAMFSLAGDATRHWICRIDECVAVPAGRYKRIRGPSRRFVKLVPDEMQVKQIQIANPVADDPDVLATWKIEAYRLALKHSKEIISVARVLYVRGHVFVQAQKPGECFAGIQAVECRQAAKG